MRNPVIEPMVDDFMAEHFGDMATLGSVARMKGSMMALIDRVLIAVNANPDVRETRSKGVAADRRKVAVYSHPYCTFHYCPNTDLCQPHNTCVLKGNTP